jgi:hypothetical protein
MTAMLYSLETSGYIEERFLSLWSTDWNSSFLPIWWINSFWFEDADIINIIDQLAILDLTGTDLIECMYGYTEMEALATYLKWIYLKVCARF